MLEDLLRGWGKEVVTARRVTACCSEEVMRQAIRRYRDYIKRSEALVMLSCAAGVKSAVLCEPGVPVLTALDSVGSAPVSRRKEAVALSRCKSCGRCVLSLTGGICPVSGCPSRKKYEPCALYPENGARCVVDATRRCVWKEIEQSGDMPGLKELRRVHEESGAERILPGTRRETPAFLRALAGWVVARAFRFDRLVDLVD